MFCWKKKLSFSPLVRFKHHNATKVEFFNNYDQRGGNKVSLFFEDKPFALQLGGELTQLDITWYQIQSKFTITN